MAISSRFRPAGATRLVTILSFLALAAPCAYTQEKSLFNGSDLTGWLAVGDTWSVQDGAITCKPSEGSSYLVWKGGAVSNFDLNCKFKFNHNFDKQWTGSGIRFRSRITNLDRLDSTGYHADLNMNLANTGSLFDAGPRGPLAFRGERGFFVNTGDLLRPNGFYLTNAVADAEKARLSFKPTDWNDYRIIASGNQIQIFLNGFQTADGIDETTAAAKSGILALTPGPIQFKEITLKEMNGFPPIAPASRLPAEAPARSKDVQATYVRQGSATLKQKGFNPGRFPAMNTEDPNGVFDSKQVYFDMRSGTEIHYEVQSASPLTELSYTGVAANDFRIEVFDPKSGGTTTSGPYNGGNPWKVIRMPLPNLTRFRVTLKTNPMDWLFVEDIHFGSSASTPATAVETPGASSPRERSLFNGRDLTGWKAAGDYWSVKDGAITCEPSNDATGLVWQDGSVSDFEFNCKFRFRHGLDKRYFFSGIRFRSRVVNPERFYMQGPCADLNINFANSGSYFEDGGRGGLVARGQRAFIVRTDNILYPAGVYVAATLKDADKARASYKPDDWNDYKIIAAGNRIAVFFNGIQTLDAVDETSFTPKSGALALREGPIQFKDITLKEFKNIPPTLGASRLPVDPARKSGAVNAFFIKQGSAPLREKGFKDGKNPAMETTDPNDVFRSMPIYFDMRFASEAHYEVVSMEPLTELSYTGVRFANFRIEILDPKGALILSSGPYYEGNWQKLIRIPLPSLTHFQVVLKSDPIDWLLVSDLHFGSAPPGTVPGLAKWTLPAVAAAGPTPIPQYVARATPIPVPALAYSTPPPAPTPLPPPPPPSREKERDPFLGRWRMGRNIAVFSEDGSAHRSAPGFNEDGRWTKKGGSYEIDWSSGREIDLVVMKDNYQRLGGRDKKGREIILGVRVRESDQ